MVHCLQFFQSLDFIDSNYITSSPQSSLTLPSPEKQDHHVGWRIPRFSCTYVSPQRAVSVIRCRSRPLCPQDRKHLVVPHVPCLGPEYP